WSSDVLLFRSLAREKLAAAKQAEEERLAREKLAAAKQAEEERLAREKLAAAKQAEEERLAREKLAAAKRAEVDAAALAKQRAALEQRVQEKARREAEARARDEARRAAAEARRARDEARRTAGSQRVASAEGGRLPRRTLSFVGFRPSEHASRVFIRTDAPAHYEIREADEKTIVVALANTGIAVRNTARFLDTSFFDTPVRLVNPTEVGRDVHVEIKLKEVVPYRARQDGADLVLEFEGR
ncbi:MAG TPA: AMIN domain-containing protein, partial [Myxococcaceae bacterium]|nr:AMIN domain-containing protein [Myxococcaceae bacterium]